MASVCGTDRNRAGNGAFHINLRRNYRTQLLVVDDSTYLCQLLVDLG